MKYFYTILLLLFVPIFAMAQIIPTKIYAITPRHLCSETITIGDNIKLYAVLDDTKKNQEINHAIAEEIDVKIKEYIKAKRGKRNGYYKIEYKNYGVTMQGSMKVATPKDAKNFAQKAGITITGHILKIPGFSQAVALSKGLITPNENESRLKSAGKNLYESTPLTYVEKGIDFDVEEDGFVILKLKEKENIEE